MITSASAYGVQPVYPNAPTQQVQEQTGTVEVLFEPSVRSRVSQEREELRTKIFKLESFILSDKYNALEPEEAKDLLVEQLQAMKVYSDILFERIQLLPQ